MIGIKFEAANNWARSLQLAAPVSGHHERAVGELWGWLEPLGLRTALEVGAGEPPHLLARMLSERGIRAETLDAVSESTHQGMDVHDLRFPDGAFDLVAARHCLEHVLCPYLALLEMARVSRRWLLVVVPVGSDKSRDWPDHLWHLGRDGWELIFRKLGLRIAQFKAGDHTEAWALERGLWQDWEWRYLLEKGGPRGG